MQAPLFSGLPAPTRRRKLPKASFGVPIDFGELTEEILEESKVTRALNAWVPASRLWKLCVCSKSEPICPSTEPEQKEIPVAKKASESTSTRLIDVLAPPKNPVAPRKARQRFVLL